MISNWKLAFVAFSFSMLGCAVESTAPSGDEAVSEESESAVTKTCGMYGPSCPTGYTCNITSNVGINPQGTCAKKCSFYGTKCTGGQICQYDGNGGINPQGICVDPPKTCSMYGTKCPTGYVCKYDGNVGINPSGTCVKK